MTLSPTFDTQNAIRLISEQSGVEISLIQTKMNEKITKFGGLLTEQGALVLLSKEMNTRIPLFDKPVKKLAIGELTPGMNNVDVHARVKILDRIKPYAKNGKEGKFLSVRLADETGEALFTFWNEQAEEAMQKGLQIGSALSLSNARVGSFNQMVQLSLGYNGTYVIENAQTIGLSTQTIEKKETKTEKGTFLTVEENQTLTTRASIVDVNAGKGFFVKCNACGARLQTPAENCPQCGKEKSVETRLLVSLLLDDGTKTMRAVAFEGEALKLYEGTKEELLTRLQNEEEKKKLNTKLHGTVLDITARGKMGMDRTTLELTLQRVTRVPFENA